MSALICGSFAYDTIMVFPDQFKNHILPDKVHMLNVCFLVVTLINVMYIINFQKPEPAKETSHDHSARLWCRKRPQRHKCH